MTSRWRAHLRTMLRTTGAGLRASPLTAVVATITIALCLLLMGSFALLVTNMEQILDRFGEEFRISAYLEDELTEEELELIRTRLRAAPGVERVVLVTKQQAMERFRASQIGRAALLDGLDANPLPASLELVLAPAHRNAVSLDRLAEAVDGLPGITDLGYGSDWVAGYGRAVELVRGIGLSIGGVLLIATLLIVTNTIRLALVTRSDEVAILRLVGASRVFIAVPYLLEGAVQGLLGGALGMLLLFGCFHMLLPAFGGSLELVLGHVSPAFLPLRTCLWLVAGGAGLGAFGSAAALAQGRWNA